MSERHDEAIKTREINKDNIDKSQNDLLNFIHQEFIEAQRRNEKTFDNFKVDNTEQHKEIIISKESAHTAIFQKIDRSIEAGNALASEMRGCYKEVEGRQSDYETKQNIQTYKIAMVVAGITFALTLFFQYLWEILTKKA